MNNEELGFYKLNDKELNLIKSGNTEAVIKSLQRRYFTITRRIAVNLILRTIS